LNFDHYANVELSDDYLTAFQTNLKSRYNVNSSHILGSKAKDLLSESIDIVNKIFPMYKGVEFIPGGGTYANDFVFFSLLPNRAICGEKDIVIMSNIEHSSILKIIAGKLTDKGFVVIKIPVTKDGFVNLESLKRTLIEFNGRVKMVSIMNVNNEIGTIQPIDKIAIIVKEFATDAIFHSDACQGIDRIRHLKYFPDVVTSSLYKVGGGHMGLILHNLKISQKMGTPDVLTTYASIIALKTYIVNCEIEREESLKIKKQIVEKLEGYLVDVDHIFILNDLQENNIIGLIIPNIKSSYVQTEISKSNICIGSGSACNKNSPSNTLMSMGYSMSSSEGFIRISFNPKKINNIDDINRFTIKLSDIIKQLCAIKRSGEIENIYIAPVARKIVYPSLRKELSDEYTKVADLPIPHINGVMVTFGELVLKGLNKYQFIRRLKININKHLKLFNVKTTIMRGYAIVTTNDDIDEIIEICSKIPGIATIHPLYIYRFTDNEDELATYTSSIYSHMNRSNLPFCIRTKINNSKKYNDKTNRDLEYSLGKHIKDRFAGTVKLTSPPFQINIIIEKDVIMFYTKNFRGYGGLPGGTEGDIVVLVNESNVNRSILAIFEISKRGAYPTIMIDRNLSSEFKDILMGIIQKTTSDYRIEEIEFNSDNIKINTFVKNIMIESNTTKIKKYFRLLKGLGEKIDKHIFTSTIAYEYDAVIKILKDNNIPIYTDNIDQCIDIIEKHTIISLDTRLLSPEIKGLSLLSGGIDSPVASIITAQMGCNIDFIHFSSNSTDVKNIIKTIKTIILESRIIDTQLYFVDISQLQRYIVGHCKEEYRTMLYKAYMIKIANDISYKNNYDVIIMGNSWGQVASQTPENLYVTDRLSNIPIFNPLITKNKEDIMSLAKKYNTFECSMCNGEDCCTMFTPQHPVLRSSISYITGVITKISDYQKLIDINIIPVIMTTP
jgi:thiamine biosynthesis protein ThiI